MTKGKSFKYLDFFTNTNGEIVKKYLKVLFVVLVLAFATISVVIGTQVLSEERITTNTAQQRRAVIYGDIVVFEDERNNATTGVDIWGYNLVTKQEFQITTNTADQYEPAIYCGRVVWHDLRSGDRDIYLANLDVVCEAAHKSLPIAQILKILGLYPKE